MKKIKEGALFAIGFTIVAFAISYGYSIIVANFYDYDEFDFGQSTENVEVIESRIEKRENRLVVLGKFQNNGDTKLSSLTITADFFGKDGTFLDQCKEYSSGSLLAGSSAHFRLECSSCADLTLDDVASHDVKVTSSF